MADTVTTVCVISSSALSIVSSLIVSPSIFMFFPFTSSMEISTLNFPAILSRSLFLMGTAGPQVGPRGSHLSLPMISSIVLSPLLRRYLLPFNLKIVFILPPFFLYHRPRSHEVVFRGFNFVCNMAVGSFCCETVPFQLLLRETDLDFAILYAELAAYAAGRALNSFIIFENAKDTVMTDRAHSGVSMEFIVAGFNRYGHFNT